MSVDDSLASAWRQQALWSRLAGKLKRDLARWRRLVLLSLVAAAVVAALAGHIETNSRLQSGMTLAAAAVVVGVPFVRSVRLSKTAFRDWTRARSASEALKREVYGYLTGTGVYRDQDAMSRRLADRVAGIVDRVEDLAPTAATLRIVPKPVPEPLTIGAYLDERAGTQVEGYYRPNAAKLEARDRALVVAERAFTVAAVVSVAVAAVSGWTNVVAWVGVITTVAGALLAHREGERLEYLVISYTATANRLEGVLEAGRIAMAAGPLLPADEDALVAECEDAISVENQAWMATWVEAPRGV